MSIAPMIQPKFGTLILEYPREYPRNQYGKEIPQAPDRFLTSASTLTELIASDPDKFQNAQINIDDGSYIGPENPQAVLPDGSIWLLSRNRRLWPVMYSPLNGKVQEHPELAAITRRLRADKTVSATGVTAWLKAFAESQTGPMAGEGPDQLLTYGLLRVGTEKDQGKFQYLVPPPASVKAIP